MSLKFYRCSHCGQIIVKVKESRVALDMSMARRILVQ